MCWDFSQSFMRLFAKYLSTMSACVFRISVFMCFAYVSSQGSAEQHGRATKLIPVVDALISRLEEDLWSPDDLKCLQATLNMLRGVKNNTLWAIWVWDSMQPPVGSMYGSLTSLGNYDQCLKAPWSAKTGHPGIGSQYCLVDVKSPGVDQVKDFGPFDTAEEYYRTQTKDGRVFNEHYLGVCLPASCSPSSVAKLAQHLLHLTHLPGDVTVDPRDCEIAGEVIKYPTGYYAFWSVVGLLIAISFYSTLINNEENTRKAVFSTITKSFCLKRNYNSLFSVSRDDLKVLHGIRFLTAVVIVAVHEAFYHLLTPVINGLDVNEILNSTLGQIGLHLEIVVDTFFAMSGLLITRNLLQVKQKNVLFILLKRYFRLIGPYALCIMYLVTTAMYIDRGPFWTKANNEEFLICKNYWWKCFLMINTDTENLCDVTTWYISCDFQLAILAIFIFCVFRRSKKLGLAVFAVIAVTITANLAFNVYSRQLDILPFSFKAIALRRRFTYLNFTYLKSHVRAGSYLVGMVMGYIITTFKPSEYRNTIGKNRSIVMATLSLLSMTVVLSIGAIFAARPYDALEAAVVVATNRIIWAVAVCCLIGLCEYGTLPLIPEILSWSGFVPFSKLSYCLYLVHPLLLQWLKFSARGPASFHILSTISNACGVIVLGCAASFVLHLVVEAPIINISNALFVEKSEPLEQNGTKKSRFNTMSPQNHNEEHNKMKLS